jgi:hypothetical protein
MVDNLEVAKERPWLNLASRWGRKELMGLLQNDQMIWNLKLSRLGWKLWKGSSKSSLKNLKLR